MHALLNYSWECTIESVTGVDWREDYPEDPEKVYWRFEAYTYWSNEQAFATISCHPWEIVKPTPKGVWVERYGPRKLVLHSSHKKWAYPTKQEAWESFLIRLKWRRRHQEKALESTRVVETTVEEYLNKCHTDQ